MPDVNKESNGKYLLGTFVMVMAKAPKRSSASNNVSWRPRMIVSANGGGNGREAV